MKDKFYFKIIYQTKIHSCGIACLKMILNHYGLNFEKLEPLEKNCKKGISIYKLCKMAHSLGLKTNNLKVPLPKISKIASPCICLWKKRHYVILYKITSKYFHIADPALGSVKYNKTDFERFFNYENGYGIIIDFSVDI